MKFSKEELTSLMQEYEATHHVDEYVVDDWHVWPLLRLTLCMGWLPIKAPSVFTAQKKVTSTPYMYIRKLANQAYGWLKYQSYTQNLKHLVSLERKYDPEHTDQHDAKRDVVLLTLSDRRIKLNDSLYEIYSDPFIEILKDIGVSTLVWEQGLPRYPRHSSSAWISRRLEAECRQIKPLHSLSETPSWFASYQTLSTQIIGRVVEWQEVKGRIDAVTKQSLVFEQWLRKVTPSLFISVCWYSPLVMAATMAAHRLGIKTVEMQHGLQDNVHFAYSCWERSPKNGYEVVPHFFWCWGANSAKSLRLNNPAFTPHAEFLVGGNLWLNRWLSHNQPCPKDNLQLGITSFTKTILVTLQLDIEEILFEAIKESPHSWKWLIRFHPARDNIIRKHEEQRFRELQHPGVEIEHNDMLLYELLGKSNIHITGYSTCTLEAIALGIPTIIISRNGRTTFKQLIEKGVVLYAETTDDLLNCIRFGTLHTTASTAIQQEFARDHEARTTLSYLLECEGPIQ